MAKKKDENYYKKLYKKLKKSVTTENDKLLLELDLFQKIFIIIAKRSKDKKVVIALKEVMEIKKSDRLSKRVEKNKDIVFQIEE